MSIKYQKINLIKVMDETAVHFQTPYMTFENIKPLMQYSYHRE